MLNEEQFGKFKPKKPTTPRGIGCRGSGSYKFLPIPKSQEERDLMEAKARAINLRIRKAYQASIPPKSVELSL